MRVPRPSHSVVRATLVTVFLVLLAVPVAAFVSAQVGATESPEVKRAGEVSGPDRAGYTVITTQEFSASYPSAELIVLAPDGTPVYVDDRWDTYFDVDPVPGRSETVEYVAADYISHPDCNDNGSCTREVFVRENFTTGGARVLWSRVTPGKANTRVHDIDRIDESRIVVADVYRDEVFVYDTERQVRVWTWRAQRDYPLGSGGPFPEDWTHINDVEVLPDGRLMVSLRNQDSVVFLARNGTLLDRQTLGSDGRHDVLYEQHNPDYLPGASPSVLVADSENDRVVEYRRRDGEWRRTWHWRDQRLRWPRDADRLPNGHTLITDTNGDRVLEVNESGAVVWSVEVGLPYEAERLSTGPESAGGPNATRAGLASRGPVLDRASDQGQRGALATAGAFVRQVVPESVRNGLTFVLPPGLYWWHVPLLGAALLDLGVLALLELRRSNWRFVWPVAASDERE
ncbi:aryl-sulfate sulfotransferase [Haloarcula litorea]|uniref:aryl-sulfate sulfotransferase n=1 Tax=Haloarcula litorea TaxID=3032579 RepID=UPI0023E8B8F2|nr:aryl-sulfate sulfotransferase [Halomicroarcula sp. GDY20]